MNKTNSNVQINNTTENHKRNSGFGISFVNTPEDFKKKVIKCVDIYNQIEDLRKRYLEGNNKIHVLITKEQRNLNTKRWESQIASETRVKELKRQLETRNRIYQKNQSDLRQYFDYLINDIFDIKDNDHILYKLYKEQVLKQNWKEINPQLVVKTVEFFDMNKCLKQSSHSIDYQSEIVIEFTRKLYSEGVGFNIINRKITTTGDEIMLEDYKAHKLNKFYFKFLRLLYVKFVVQKDSKSTSKNKKNNERDLSSRVVVNEDFSSPFYVPQELYIKPQRTESCWEQKGELKHKDNKKKDNIYITDTTESNPEKYSLEYYREEMKKRKKEEKKLKKQLKNEKDIEAALREKYSKEPVKDVKEVLREKYSKEQIHKSEKDIIAERANRYIGQNIRQSFTTREEKNIDLDVHEIMPKDFLTRSNLIRCSNADHKLVDIIGEIKILNVMGDIELVSFPAAYCSTCKKYYVLESEYRKLKLKGRIICKVVEHSFWTQPGNNNAFAFNQESLLHILGYNVNAQEDLPVRQRQRILEIIINENILTKAEVCSHLDYLINRSKGRANMANACEKWRADRDYISKHNRRVETVKVRSIDHSNYYKN